METNFPSGCYSAHETTGNHPFLKGFSYNTHSKAPRIPLGNKNRCLRVMGMWVVLSKHLVWPAVFYKNCLFSTLNHWKNQQHGKQYVIRTWILEWMCIMFSLFCHCSYFTDYLVFLCITLHTWVCIQTWCHNSLNSCVLGCIIFLVWQLGYYRNKHTIMQHVWTCSCFWKLIHLYWLMWTQATFEWSNDKTKYSIMAPYWLNRDVSIMGYNGE